MATRSVNPEVRWGYSQAGQLLADTAQGNRVTTHAPDFYGRDSVTTDVVGAWRLSYETNRGIPDTIFTPWNDTLTYVFGAQGQLTGPTVRGGGATLTRTVSYELLGRVYQLANTVPGRYSAGEYSTDNEPTASAMARYWAQQQDSGGPTRVYKDSLTYDGFERVHRFLSYRSDTLMAADTFSFDYAGNIFRNQETRNYDDATDRMYSRGGHSYSYDANNNLVTWSVDGGSSFEYGYDGADRLVSVRYGSTLIARYAYDVLGRRIVRRVYNAGPNGAAAEYVRMIYRGGQVTAEADSGNILRLSYTWGVAPDDLVAIRNDSSSQVYYTVQDDLHSVRGLVRRDGSATWQSYRRYGPYGTNQDSAGTDPVPQRYRWVGREFDPETGLYYVRARYYDPSSQRFTQEDPLGNSGGENLFAYGGGNPTGGRDINGLEMHHDYSMRDSDLRSAIDPFSDGEWGAWLQGGAGFHGSMINAWDLLTGMERGRGDASFDRYFDNFCQRSCGNASRSAMSREEYRLAYASLSYGRAVADIDAGPLFSTQRIQAWLESGVVIVDRAGGKGLNFSSTGRNKYGVQDPSGTTWFHPGIFTLRLGGFPRLLNQIVHEYAHSIGYGWADGQDWEACRYAFLVSGWRAGSSECRGY